MTRNINLSTPTKLPSALMVTVYHGRLSGHTRGIIFVVRVPAFSSGESVYLKLFSSFVPYMSFFFPADNNADVHVVVHVGIHDDKFSGLGVRVAKLGVSFWKLSPPSRPLTTLSLGTTTRSSTRIFAQTKLRGGCEFRSETPSIFLPTYGVFTRVERTDISTVMRAEKVLGLGSVKMRESSYSLKNMRATCDVPMVLPVFID